jgi:hypothetical protein
MSSSAIKRAAPANPVTAAVATAQLFSLASNNALACSLPVPGKLTLEAKRFTIRAEGNLFTAGAAYTAKATLYAQQTYPASPLVPANWIQLCSGTARTVPNTWTPWWIEANVIFDSTSGLLQGTFNQMVMNLFDASAAVTAGITLLNGSNQPVTQGGTVVQPADPVFYVAVGLTFNTAGANVGNLANFEIAF